MPFGAFKLLFVWHQAESVHRSFAESVLWTFPIVRTEEDGCDQVVPGRCDPTLTYPIIRYKKPTHPHECVLGLVWCSRRDLLENHYYLKRSRMYLKPAFAQDPCGGGHGVCPVGRARPQRRPRRAALEGERRGVSGARRAQRAEVRGLCVYYTTYVYHTEVRGLCNAPLGRGDSWAGWKLGGGRCLQ